MNEITGRNPGNPGSGGHAAADEAQTHRPPTRGPGGKNVTERKSTWDNLTNAQSPTQFFANQNDPLALAGDVIHDYAVWCSTEFDITATDAYAALREELDGVRGWRKMPCAQLANILRVSE